MCWQALNGFLMMMTQNGKLLYISDNAAEYLGHSMASFFFYLHFWLRQLNSPACTLTQTVFAPTLVRIAVTKSKRVVNCFFVAINMFSGSFCLVNGYCWYIDIIKIIVHNSDRKINKNNYYILNCLSCWYYWPQRIFVWVIAKSFLVEINMIWCPIFLC